METVKIVRSQIHQVFILGVWRHGTELSRLVEHFRKDDGLRCYAGSGIAPPVVPELYVCGPVVKAVVVILDFGIDRRDPTAKAIAKAWRFVLPSIDICSTVGESPWTCSDADAMGSIAF
jgi:hypothetical protein